MCSILAPMGRRPASALDAASEMKSAAPCSGRRAVARFSSLPPAPCRHAFQKKSKSGIATPRHEITLIEQRLKRAKEDHAQWLADTKTTAR